MQEKLELIEELSLKKRQITKLKNIDSIQGGGEIKSEKCQFGTKNYRNQSVLCTDITKKTKNKKGDDAL